MSKYLKFCFVLAAAVLQVFISTGCAPHIRLSVERPPNLNTAGIRRIAVMPFEADYRDGREIAQYATSVAISRIREMNRFTLVDPAEIDRLRRNNQSIENHADALFTGRVTRINVTEDTQHGEYKDRDGQIVYFTDYIRAVEIEFNYSLVRTRDGSLIGPVFKRGTHRSVNRNYSALFSETILLRAAVDGQLWSLGRDLAPHTVIETRTFASDKSKNPALKAEMKDALALVRIGNYRQALTAYLEIYERYKSVAAAENASILHEALGDTQVAAEFMQRVFNETGNPRTQAALARLNRILQDQATLANEYGDAGSAADRVSAFASAEIRKILPDAALVWVYNNSPGNDMVEAVADNIVADFIRSGVGVVDRDRLNAALIETEQIFQMSGAVNDDDIVRIGNTAGANTIVIIGVAGTGAMRRLQVRVLDIERGVPIMQSDTGERWQI